MALTETTVKLGRRTFDLTGHTYEKLYVESFAGYDKHKMPLWNCECACGNSCVVSANTMRQGKTKSCGCHKIAIKKTHGLSGTPEYHAYIGAKGRCTNQNDMRWDYYGGRGIKFLFNSFEELIAEIGMRPTKNHSLDRIDNSGNYESGNVRWATWSEQMENRRQYEKPWLIGNTHASKNQLEN